MKKLTTTIIVLLVCSLLVFRIYKYCQPKNISFIKVGESSSDIEQSGSWWFVAEKETNLMLNQHNIAIPSINWEKHNLLITEGRKIQEITLFREKSFPFGYSHFPKIVFRRKVHKYKWFIYKIDKIKLYQDPKSGDIIIED